MGPLGTQPKHETVSTFEIQERVARVGPNAARAYVWEHWSDVEQFTEDGQPVTYESLQPIIRELARVFETSFRIVRVTTTTTVVCEELDSTLED